MGNFLTTTTSQDLPEKNAMMQPNLTPLEIKAQLFKGQNNLGVRQDLLQQTYDQYYI